MSQRENNFNNTPLSDVESFVLLLSELNIINLDIPNLEVSNLDVSNLGSDRQTDVKDYDQRSNSKRIDLEEDLENRDQRHQSNRNKTKNYSSFYDDIPQNTEGQKLLDKEYLRTEDLGKGDISQDSLLGESDAVRIIQELFIENDLSTQSLKNGDKPELENILSVLSFDNAPLDHYSRNIPKNNQRDIPKDNRKELSERLEKANDADALHLLQDILVVPEIEDLRSFKISVEQKLRIVESQVNSPELINKINELENLVQHASIDLSNLGSKLTELGNEQINIPTEIAHVRNRVSELEHQIYEPEELVRLLLPIIAELLSIKSNQSTAEMSLAITPIIAEVILERSQLDRVAMSRAISDILPNAISEQIRNNPEEIAKAIGPEVGAAMREQFRLDRDAVIDVLAPEMGEAIKRQIALERDSMVDALYPVIGNTIAKYFAEAIRSINQKVEQTFSIEGLQRKIRAKLQGVSEAELILKESVLYEVQAIFLIHNLSGLVMIDIQKSDLDSFADPIDSDMLAGMLTAIRSFANECMSRSSRNTELDAINYSGSKILLEVAGYCYLAVIVRGEPDRELVTKIRDVFGHVIQVYGDRLKQFDGNPNIISIKVEIALKTLMEVQKSNLPKRSIRTVLSISLALLTLAFVSIGIYQYQSNRDRQLESKILDAFASNPELAVYRLNAIVEGDSLKLSGKLPNQYLRDRAFQIAITAAKSEVESNNISINNNIYAVNVPPDPILVMAEVQRLTKVLNYTRGVNIASQYKDGKVTVTGRIEQPRMVLNISQSYTKIPGVTTVVNATTIIIPKLSTRIYFPFGVTNLQPTDLEKLVEIKAFLDMYPDYSLKIYAKSDNIGDRGVNYLLGVKRTQALREALLQNGVKANRLHISGIIEPSIQQPSDQVARWVEFEPTLK